MAARGAVRCACAGCSYARRVCGAVCCAYGAGAVLAGLAASTLLVLCLRTARYAAPAALVAVTPASLQKIRSTDYDSVTSTEEFTLVEVSRNYEADAVGWEGASRLATTKAILVTTKQTLSTG